MYRNKQDCMPFLSVFEHTMHGLILHLYSLANSSSREELICLGKSQTNAIVQLQTEATPLHRLHSPHVDMPHYWDLEWDSAFPKQIQTGHQLISKYI